MSVPRQPWGRHLAGSLLLVMVLMPAVAQSVGTLRSQPFELPANEADNELMTTFFGAFDAVQAACSTSTVGSLEAENALAACATFRPTTVGQVIADAGFTGMSVSGGLVFETPWTSNPDFGSVRWLTYKGFRYVVGFDEETGQAIVVRFQD